MKHLLVSAILVLAATTATAQPIVRRATPEEATAAAGAERFKQREYLKRMLFGVGKLPAGCFYEVIDPSAEEVTGNLVIVCGGERFDICDAPGVDCD